MFHVVLVRPQIAENTGLTARAMKAFGFASLRLVTPGFDAAPEALAGKTASGAHEVLAHAHCFDSLAQAIADCHHAAAFSRRDHRFARPWVDLPRWRQSLQEEEMVGDWALVFGPEDFGLSNEEKKHCEIIVQIPTAHPTLSLNLAQAVTVVLYEIAQAVQPTAINQPASNAATLEDQQRLFAYAVSLLDSCGHFQPGRREQQMEVLRMLLQRLRLSREEYSALMGAARSVERGLDQPPDVNA